MQRRTPLQQVIAEVTRDQATVGTSKQRRTARRRDDSKWRAECLLRRGARCRACGTRTQIQMDHLIPRAAGGPSVVENGLPLCGSFSNGCHDLKTAHKLLIERDMLDADQVSWLAAGGHAVWLLDGSVGGRHCTLFAATGPD